LLFLLQCGGRGLASLLLQPQGRLHVREAATVRGLDGLRKQCTIADYHGQLAADAALQGGHQARAMVIRIENVMREHPELES
jgi:hypothetical protein